MHDTAEKTRGKIDGQSLQKKKEFTVRKFPLIPVCYCLPRPIQPIQSEEVVFVDHFGLGCPREEGTFRGGQTYTPHTTDIRQTTRSMKPAASFEVFVVADPDRIGAIDKFVGTPIAWAQDPLDVSEKKIRSNCEFSRPACDGQPTRLSCGIG